LILDEAHFLKNYKTERTKTLSPILSKSKHVFLLSGTPALSKPVELFTLLNIIRPDIFYSFYEFG
jgi:SWI/SNF-related matrix-associated actin-dependent regulator of chromatin subfamily A-like protein 1